MDVIACLLATVGSDLLIFQTRGVYTKQPRKLKAKQLKTEKKYVHLPTEQSKRYVWFPSTCDPRFLVFYGDVTFDFRRRTNIFFSVPKTVLLT